MEIRETMPIDTVDLAASGAGSAFAAALMRTGFVQVTGHGIDPEIRKRYRAACDAFFDQPIEQKQRFVHPEPEANRGYRSRGSEALSYSLGEESPPDLFESFNAAPDPMAGSTHRLLQSTPWPDEIVPDFSGSLVAMAAEFATLAGRIDEMIEELTGWAGLAENSGSGPDTVAAINYRPDPDGAERVLVGQQRMGAHSDYTSFTILDAEPVRGLQIVDAEGSWTDVVPDAEAVLVNVGDLLAMATNDDWPSILHRVVPMEAGSAPFRRSVAYFHYPNLDVEVKPLPKFTGDDEPRYQAVRVEDHLLDKLVAPKVKRASTSTMTTAGRLSSDTES